MKKIINKISKSALLMLVLVIINPAFAQKTWNGNVNNQWDNASNWTPSGIPLWTDNVIIPAGTPNSPVISQVPVHATFSAVWNLTVDAGATLTLASKELHIYGVSLTGGTTGYGILTGNAAVHIVSPNPSFILSKNLQIDILYPEPLTSGIVNGSTVVMVKLDLEGDVNVGNGGELIFRSVAADQCAFLDNFNYAGTLSQSGTGVIKMERYIPSPGGYHMIGAAAAMNLNQFGATGTGQYIPYFPPVPGNLCDETRAVSAPGTVYIYNESNPQAALCAQYSWYAEGPSVAATPGVGYTAFLSAGMHTFTGLPNQNSTYTISGLANSGWSCNSLQSSTTPFNYTSGWNLLSNPFLAPLNMAATVSSNSGFDDAAVYEASGAYAGTYQPLIVPTFYNGPNGGVVNAGYIAPFEGVMVHRGNGGPVSNPPVALGPASFTFNKLNCSATQNPIFYKQATGMGLTIQVDGNGHSDYTYTGFSNDATSDFDIGIDSRKMASNNGFPTLYTKNNNEFMSVNTYHSIAETPSIVLGIWPGVNGTFTFTFKGQESFDANAMIVLEDKVNGQMTDLRANNTYTFTQTLTDNPDRFILHFSESVALGEKNIKGDAIKMFTSGNTLYVDMSNMENPDATIDIYDVIGQHISSDKFGNSGIFSKQITNIATGYIMVQITSGDFISTEKFLITSNKY